MPELPYIPDWQSIHPLLIHFPLVLLFLAPLFVLFAVFTEAPTRRTLVISSISVMVLGLVFLLAAFESGQMVASCANGTEVQMILDRHAEFASIARRCFTTSLLLFALCLLLCKLLRLELNELSPLLPVGAIAFYALGLLWLVNAAYNGERLVHEFGVGRMTGP